MSDELPITKQALAVRAVIEKDGKLLVIREAGDYAGGTNHGKYDFPGGKVKVGENPLEALRRETREEIGADITIRAPFHIDQWCPTVRSERLQIIGVFLRCGMVGDEVKLGPDHDDYQWVDAANYASLPLIAETKNALEAYYR
jgi:8-oxo-dGTP diphosphatase